MVDRDDLPSEYRKGDYPKLKAYAVLYNPERSHHLVWQGRDPNTGEVFQRLLGGHVEFGEYGRQAVIREIQEEVGVVLDDPQFLAVVENVFEYAGAPGHEVVFVYTATMPQPSPIPPEGGLIDDNGIAVWAVWRPVQDEGWCPLYPEGLSEHLRG